MSEKKFEQIKPIQQPRVNPILRIWLTLSLAASGALSLVRPAQAESATPPGSASGVIKHEERKEQEDSPSTLGFVHVLEEVINNYVTQQDDKALHADAITEPFKRTQERKDFVDAIKNALTNSEYSFVLDNPDFMFVLDGQVATDFLTWQAQEIQCLGFANLLSAAGLSDVLLPKFGYVGIGDASQLVPASMYANGKSTGNEQAYWRSKDLTQEEMVYLLKDFAQIKKGDNLIFMYGEGKGHIASVIDVTEEGGEKVVVIVEANRDLVDGKIITDGKVHIRTLTETQFNQLYTTRGGGVRDDETKINDTKHYAAIGSGQVFILRHLEMMEKMNESPFQTPTQ